MPAVSRRLEKDDGAVQHGLMAAEQQGFDQVLAQLRQVVEKLEGGNLSLEQSLQAFEEGVKLARQGSQILDAAETRVEVLLRDENNRVAPFEAGGGESGGK
jgi:exodeoxyribonuclease VII small subunit